MSTKIYNSFKYDGTIFELMDDFKKIDDDYRSAVEQAVKFLIPIFIELYPEYGSEDPNSKGNIIPINRKFLKIFREHSKKEYPESHDVFCFNASAVVYPVENVLLVQFFGLDIAPFGHQLVNNTIDALIESGKLTDYHYQYQSDPWYEYDDVNLSPEEYAEAEKDYEERKRLWDIVFDKYSTPSKAGLIKEFKLSEYDIFEFI